MFSDFIKGKRKFNYPIGIQNGIKLHRDLDAFTDNNEHVKEIASFFKADYGRYASPVADVTLDYFLANDKSLFASQETLLAFSLSVYKQLETYVNISPDGFAAMFPYMRTQNWLYNYRTEEGISKSLSGLYRRANYMPDPERAFEIFVSEREAIGTIYRSFIPALKSFAASEADGYL